MVLLLLVQNTCLSFQSITVQLAGIHQHDQFLAALSVLFPSASVIPLPCPFSLYELEKPEGIISLNTYSKPIHSYYTHISS